MQIFHHIFVDANRRISIKSCSNIHSSLDCYIFENVQNIIKTLLMLNADTVFKSDFRILSIKKLIKVSLNKIFQLQVRINSLENLCHAKYYLTISILKQTWCLL